ncbi:MAG: histidine kinase [Tannerella sp.]|jgi:signal transduction histidine kinase|nr:histidine kinase [Tannerella sp.]
MKKITFTCILSAPALSLYAQSGAESLTGALFGNGKLLYWGLGTACIIALLLAFGLLIYRHRFRAMQARQLNGEKQLIATQAVLDGETAERSRLARDLHDGVGGMLSAVKLNLNEIRNSAAPGNAEQTRFGDTLKILDQSIVELRRIAHQVMPETLMRYGLKTSVEDFCHTVPNAHFQYFGSEDRLDYRLEVLLYRCACELVNNAVKYADAADIHIQLMIEDGLASLTVHDNGVGFDPLKDTIGTGLRNMRTKVLAYNGNMYIKSVPGKDTEVSIEIENTNRMGV